MAATRTEVLRRFVEVNATAIDAAGGMDQVSSDGSFDAVNQRMGLTGWRKVKTLRQAIEAVLPHGRPFRLESLDIETLNETRPAQEAGGFMLPDEVEEQILRDQQDRELAMMAGFADAMDIDDDNTEESDPMTNQMSNGKVNGANNSNGAVKTASGATVQVDPATAMAMEMAHLTAENAALSQRVESNGKSAPRTMSLSMKVSEKGGLSVYGLGRFPVTLYKEQWTRLLEKAEEIKAFIKANDTTLTAKSDKK